MSVRLMVRQRSEQGGADKAQEIVLDEQQILIGRDKSCQVVLAQQAVSRQHARITQDGSLFFLEDLGSAYGTQVNGKALPKGEKRLLRNGDVVAVAQFDITFDRVADVPKGGDRPAKDKTSFIAKAVVKDVMRGVAGGGEGPYFRVMNGPKEGQKFPIEEAQELIIGREEGVDIVLKDDLVSRKHVKIRRDWSGVHVEDLGSRNGIKVNKKRTQRKTLKDRDEVEVGGIRLLYLDPSEVREAPVVLPEDEGEDTAQSGMAPKAKPPEEEEAPAEEPPAEEEPPSEGAAAEEEEAPPEEEQAAGEEEEQPASEEASAGEEPGEEGEEAEPEGEPGLGDREIMEPPHKALGGKLGGLGGATEALRDPRKLVALGVLGLVALLALGLLIAIIAGA